LGGTVTAVTATGPLASSGGTTPDISIANSTGTGSVVLQNDAAIFSATITNAVSASITTITGTSANITTVTGTTAGFSSANITQLGTTSATIATLSGTNVTYSSGTVSQLAATSATIATVSGTNATYSNGNFTSATVTTVSGTTATYTSATVTNLNSTSANITTLTGTTFGTTATTHLRGASAAITNISATSLTVTNTIAGSITGNAGTATLLQNARTINGTSFNGGANITITANTTNSATFNNGGSGGASGSTFNGSGALTVSYNTVGACASRGTSWNDGTVINNSVGMLAWKNYGNGHVIFDASAGTSPTGSAVNNTNPAGNWTGSYPTLMGWNGSATYGVRVDSCRLADTVTNGLYTTGGQTISARTVQGGSQTATMLTATGSLGGLELVSAGSSAAAFMTFHRPAAYASYFGIDTDNNFAVGGWSAGAALASMKVGSFGVGTAASGTAGEIRATNNVTAYYSDARLKDFKGKIGDALYKVSQLNGYYYTENEKAEEFGFNNKELQVGVSAQEVKAILPEVIAPAPFDMDAENKSKSGEDYMTVRYEKLVPLLIEAIKELKAEVEALKAGR
jgi:hypothetical protein